MAKLTAQYRMADRLSGGLLADIITEARSEGQSFDRISRELYADHGIEVTRQTVANWADALGVEPESAAS